MRNITAAIFFLACFTSNGIAQQPPRTLSTCQDQTRSANLRKDRDCSAPESIKCKHALRALAELCRTCREATAVQYGLHPQLAQLEMLVNPTVETLLADDAMANAGIPLVSQRCGDGQR